MQLTYKLKTSQKVAFCDDNTLLSYAPENASLKIWDLTTGTCTKTVKPPRGSPKTSAMLEMVLTPDAKTLLVGQQDGSVWVWDIAPELGFRCILQAHTDGAIGLAAFPDSARFLSASFDGSLKVWELATGTCLQTLTLPADYDHQVTCCALSPDGKRALTSHRDGIIRTWDIEAGRCNLTLTAHPDNARYVLFSPDGTHFFSGSEGGIVKVWESETGRCVHTLEGHRKSITHLTLTADGTRLVSSGFMDNSFRVWDWRTGVCLMSRGYYIKDRCSPYSVTFSPQGTWMMMEAWLELRIFRLGLKPTSASPLPPTNTPTRLHTLKAHSGQIQNLAFHPDGQLVTYGKQDKLLKSWDMASGTCTLKLLHESYTRTTTTRALALTPDGSTILAGYTHHTALGGNTDHTITLWDTQLTYALETTLVGHTGQLSAIAAFADSQRVLTGAWDHTLKVWELATGTCLQTLAYDQALHHHLTTVAVSPDGQWAVSGHDVGQLFVWDLSAGSYTALTGHTGYINRVLFLPDSRHIVSGSDDTTIRVWDRLTGACLHTLDHSGRRVTSLALSPDGTTLASAGFGESVRLWNPLTGACTQTITFEDLRSFSPCYVALSPDGHWLAVGSFSGQLALYQLGNAPTPEQPA